MYTPGILLARVKRLRSKFFRALRGAPATQQSRSLSALREPRLVHHLALPLAL